MDRALILETTFLVDLERERGRGVQGPAHAFLRDHASDRLHVTSITAGELAAGAAPDERAAWDALLGRLQIVSIDRETCWRYGQLYRHLKANGLLIPANDLWIAAIAVSSELAVVTRNERHFRRVPELRVFGYR